ncbi:MAG: TrkA family potassium uptake protein [Chloroflexi bacterium]|nr:TrkA family potassium uptake protein [Chloroflexota bacterium]
MYIVIIGGGRVGFSLAKVLMNAGHEVFVIEREGKKVQALVNELGNTALKADGSEPMALEEAGASRANVVIATTGSDEDNLAICQIAQYRFKVSRTIALVNDPENEALFRQNGVNLTVSSTQAILASIEEGLPARAPVNVMPVQGNREVVGVVVPSDAAVAGRQLGEVKLPEETVIVAVIDRAGGLKAVSEETVLEASDMVIALTVTESAQAVLDTLTSEE